MAEIYLDNAATTRVSRACLGEMAEAAESCYANPSALYRAGGEAHRRLERARKVIAAALFSEPSEFFFTASGTEANNIAVLGSARARKNFADEVVIAGFEHPSVMETARSLTGEGFSVRVVNPRRDGNLSPEEILSAVGKKTALVAVMRVNNETGALTDVASLAAEVKEKNGRTAFHCDNVQGFLKHPIRFSASMIDTASVSGHKVHAPKGIGGLYVKKGFHISPVLFGGGQERGLRSGTENVASAAAFAKAAEVYDPGTAAHAGRLNARLRGRLAELSGVFIHSPADASPFILNFSIPGFRAETLLHYLDHGGVLVGTGSACSRGSASRTLLAMGLPDDLVASSLRVSFSGENTAEQIDRLAELLAGAKDSLLRADGM